MITLTTEQAQQIEEALAEQAEQEPKYGELAGTHDWTPPNYTDEQWQQLDQEYQDHVAEQKPIGTYKDIANTMNSLWNGTSVQRQIAAELNNKLLYAAPVRTKDLTDTPENGELERLHGYID